MARQFALFIASASVLLLGAACGSESDQPTAGAIPPGLSGLPDPSELSGRTAADSLGYIAGNELTELLPNNKVVDSSATLRFNPAETPSSSLAGLAYAIFRVPTVGNGGALVWTPQWHTTPAGGKAWLGLGNLTGDNWDWRGLADPQASQQFDNPGDYVDADGTVLLVLLLETGAGQSELDLFTIELREGAGWRFVELYSNVSEAAQFVTVSSSFLHGRPHIVFQRFVANGIYDVDLLHSSTATGMEADDWTMTPLWTDGPSLTSICDLGGGYGITRVDGHESGQGSAELQYLYSADPAGPWNTEVVATDEYIATPRMAVIGGLPSIPFGRTSAPMSSSLRVWYATADAVQGGTWTVGQVSDTHTVTSSVSAVLTPPLDVDGKPVFGYYRLAGVDSEFVVAAALSAAPAGIGDWALVGLGAGSDNSMSSFMRGGNPAFSAVHYVVFPPNEVEFWTYELTGSNPTVESDWTPSYFGGLGLGQASPQGIRDIGGELAFLWSAPSHPGEHLNGTTRELQYWHSAAPGNTPADWQADVLDPDREDVSSISLIEVEGHPAVATYTQIEAGFGTEDRYLERILWGVYVP